MQKIVNSTVLLLFTVTYPDVMNDDVLTCPGVVHDDVFACLDVVYDDVFLFYSLMLSS